MQALVQTTPAAYQCLSLQIHPGFSRLLSLFFLFFCFFVLSVTLTEQTLCGFTAETEP